MDTVRFGVVGVGGMGSFHVGYLDRVDHAELTAVCDNDPVRLDGISDRSVAKFSSHSELLASGLVDAVIVATPHYSHPEITLASFDKDIHVLCEKPVAVGIGEARRVNEAYERRRGGNPKLQYGVMLQMRTASLYRKLRELVMGGELGELSRITWVATDWFRTWAYYASGGWRATWTGEGGGVLINQCPHNLDLMQWVTGLQPTRVTAVCAVAKTHPIEVEDEASAIFEYPNGAVGHFITTTGEAPGTNRLEVCGDRGRIVVEGGRLIFNRTRHAVREVRETSRESFAQVETWEIDVPHRTKGAREDHHHKQVAENFVRAIRTGEPLIAPGTEGARSVEVGNAILMAGLTRQPVELPLDGDVFDNFLKDLAKQYGGRKTLRTQEPAAGDIKASFAKA